MGLVWGSVSKWSNKQGEIFNLSELLNQSESEDWTNYVRKIDIYKKENTGFTFTFNHTNDSNDLSIIDEFINSKSFTITEINNTEKNLEDYLLENADIEAIIE